MAGGSDDLPLPDPRVVDLEWIGSGFTSIQRLGTTDDATMPDTADRYFRWLPRAFRGLVQVRGDARTAEVVLSLAGVPAIRLRTRARAPDGITFDVVGGALARPGGTFSFVRRRGGGASAVLEGFRPRLPGWLYTRTHGPVHVSVMKHFAAHLEAPRSEPDAEAP